MWKSWIQLRSVESQPQPYTHTHTHICWKSLREKFVVIKHSTTAARPLGSHLIASYCYTELSANNTITILWIALPLTWLAHWNSVRCAAKRPNSITVFHIALRSHTNRYRNWSVNLKAYPPTRPHNNQRVCVCSHNTSTLAHESPR